MNGWGNWSCLVCKKEAERETSSLSVTTWKHVAARRVLFTFLSWQGWKERTSSCNRGGLDWIPRRIYSLKEETNLHSDWNSLPRETVELPSLDIEGMCGLCKMWFSSGLVLDGWLDLKILKDFSSLRDSEILWCFAIKCRIWGISCQQEKETWPQDCFLRLLRILELW